MGRLFPIIRNTWRDSRANRLEIRSTASSSSEAHFRFDTLRHSQRLHIASPLFSLDEIIVEPRLQAPPIQVEPGQDLPVEDITTLTIPYLPDWPELPATYQAKTISLVQALSLGANLILMGNPGSGKTVSLAYLACQVARQDASVGELGNHLPFLIHISDILHGGEFTGNPLEMLTQATSFQASKTSLASLANLLQQALGSGKLLLLIDGLDETPPNLHAKGVIFVRELIEQYPGIRLVVAASPHNISGLTALGLVPVAMADWDRPTRQRFIHQWGDRWNRIIVPLQDSGAKPVDQHLMDAWLGGASDLLSPLELTLKVWSAYAGDALGAGPLDSIQSYLDRITAGLPDARPALEAFAFHLISTLQISLSEKEETMAGAGKPSPAETESDSESSTPEKSSPTKDRQEIRKTLAGILNGLEENGIIVSRSNNRWAINHPIIAGALASVAVKSLEDEELILNQPEWSGRNALLASLAARSNFSSLSDAITRSGEDPRYHTILSFARWLCLSPKTTQWRTNVLRTLATILADEFQPFGLRVRAISALVQAGDPGVKKLLNQMLAGASDSQRFLAVLGLGFSRDTQAVPQLTSLLDDASLPIGRAVCLALAAIGDKTANESLAWALVNSSDTIRQSAAEALSHDLENGYPILEEGTQMDNLLVRRAVIYGLVHVRQPRAVQILEKLAIEDKEWVVRATATHALDQIKSPELHIPRGLPALSESAWLISFASEHGLGVSPGKPAEDMLRRALREGTEEQKLAALDYLRLYGGEDDIPLILRIQHNSPGDLREAAFNALWHLGAAGIIPT